MTMKKLSVIFLICWFAGGSAALCGQPIPNRPLDYAVLVSIAGGSGSGFFLAASNSIYLVTARHVLFVNEYANWKGSSIFSANEIKNLTAIIERWRKQSDPVSDFLWQSMSNSKPEQLLLTNYQPPGSSASQARDVVLHCLNNIIGGPCIYEVERFKGIGLRPQTINLKQQLPTGSNLAHLNRLLLEDTYQLELSSDHWSLRAPQARCTFYPSRTETSSVMTLNMSVLLGKGDVRFSMDHDIAMARFEDCNPTNSSQLIFDTSVVDFSDSSHRDIPDIRIDDWARKYDAVSVGSDIFIVGFPSSIGLNEAPQIDPNAPLFRKGIVSGKNSAIRTLVLDCPSFPGNSGGPVILEEKASVTSDNFYIVGVVTEFVPFRQTWQNQQFGLVNQEWSNSGYSIAEPMDTVLDMVWK